MIIIFCHLIIDNKQFKLELFFLSNQYETKTLITICLIRQRLQRVCVTIQRSQLRGLRRLQANIEILLVFGLFENLANNSNFIVRNVNGSPTSFDIIIGEKMRSVLKLFVLQKFMFYTRLDAFQNTTFF